MFRLSQQRVSALQHQALRDFAQDLAHQLAKPGTPRWKQTPVEGIQDAVHLGIRKAQTYGIDERSPLTTFVRISFYLGSQFDIDPMLPWARPALTTPSCEGLQSVRINALRDKFLQYLEASHGREGEHLSRFLEQFNAIPDEQNAPANAEQTLAFLEQAFAAKVAYVGRETTWAMLAETYAFSREAQLEAKSSPFVLCALRMAFGYGVTNDPLFPWVRDIVQHPAPGGDRDGELWRQSKGHIADLLAPIASKEHLDGK